MENKCHKYEIQMVEEYVLVVSKDPTVLTVTVTAKDQIQKCLSCEQLNIGCSDAGNFVRLLDGNLKYNETKNV
jgi:hypothetical protein